MAKHKPPAGQLCLGPAGRSGTQVGTCPQAPPCAGLAPCSIPDIPNPGCVCRAAHPCHSSSLPVVSWAQGQGFNPVGGQVKHLDQSGGQLPLPWAPPDRAGIPPWGYSRGAWAQSCPGMALLEMSHWDPFQPGPSWDPKGIKP